MLTRLRRDDGFTMVTMMVTLVAVAFFSVAAFASVQGDLVLGADDRDRKQAYAAAEAGVHDYLSRLVANPSYWTLCDDANNPGLNQVDPSSTSRQWAPVSPGSQAQFSVELMPANGEAACSAADPQNTMVDLGSNTFRIRSTGRARNGRTRSLIATFRPKGFLNFIYFTDKETADPAVYGQYRAGYQRTKENGSERDVVAWGYAQCDKYYAQGRAGERFRGDAAQSSGGLEAPAPDGDGQWHDMDVGCSEINFVSRDEIRGPLHTNDSILVCGNPTFGRTAADDIETSGGPAPGWRTCGNGTPDFQGTYVPNAATLELPTSNTALRNDAAPQHRYIGRTQITFNGGTMNVTGKREDGTVLNGVDLPVPDGVIYVRNDPGAAAACGVYDILNTDPAAAPAGCGNAEVKGTVATNLTIGADNDVILMDSLVRASDGPMIGLIANNWVRVHHPVTRSGRSCADAPSGGIGDIQIDAAILALNHSFTVDSYMCGSPRGTITVRGAIAQKYRGIVGTFNSSGPASGYLKNYRYDNRLKHRSPPRFLDPVQAAWRIQNTVEQVPAAQ